MESLPPCGIVSYNVLGNLVRAGLFIEPATASNFGVYDGPVPFTLGGGAMAKNLAIICFAVFVLLLCTSWFVGTDEAETTPDYTDAEALFSFLLVGAGFVWFLLSGLLAFYGVAGFCDRALPSRERRSYAAITAWVLPGIVWSCYALSGNVHY
jgi:hypothetical protein